jgi:hypothetical protein
MELELCGLATYKPTLRIPGKLDIFLYVFQEPVTIEIVLFNPKETDVPEPDQGPKQGDKRDRSNGGTRLKKQRHQKHKRTKKRNMH